MTTSNLYKYICFILIAGTFLFSSCEKSQNETLDTQDEALLSINLEGLEYEAETELYANTSTSPEKEIPTHIQYVDEDFHIESQLIPVQENNAKELTKGLKQNASAVRKELFKNVKYKLLVYGDGGNLVASRDYIYGSETVESAIVLNTYTNYTFIVVSSRSTSLLPSVQNEKSLSTATVADVNADLLYWSKTTKLSKGQNFLAAILKPKFSEVTTTLQMDQTMTGAITAISNAVFNPVVEKVSLKLSDGSLIYGTVNTAGKGVTFPALETGQRSITATPTTLIHDKTSTASLKFGTLTVDGETKSNITVSNLSIKPGYRYNLILTLKTCTEAVNGTNGFNWEFEETKKTINEGTWWNPKNVTYTGINFDANTFKKNGEVISFQYTEVGADYGFVYDILELDNAFNLEVNDQPLFGTNVSTNDIQFQNNATLTTQNIEFADGSQYQSNQVAAIWNLKGTATKPLVRVVIGRNGDVLMYGSKTSGGELLPLRLKNNAKFNKVTWNGGNGTNKIKATTRVEGKTVMKSLGSGRRKIPCKD
jgi:hypothetical protein